MSIAGHDVVDILINWFPMFLLIGVWIIFLVRVKSGPFSRYQKDHLDLTRRQTESLERIAALLEKQAR